MLLRFALLIVVLAGALLLNLCIGEVTVAPVQALASVFDPGHAPNADVATMLSQIRVPRLLAAALVGAGLATSGCLLQALSRNYLADPFLTGVSSGAGLSVAIAIVVHVPFSALPVVALAGGLAAAILVAFLSRTPSGLSVSRLLLSGVAISSVCTSLITLSMLSMSSTFGMGGLYYWLAGTITGKTWAELVPAGIYTIGAFFAALLMCKPMRLLSLGPASAASLGLNVPLFQWLILVAAVILCGACVSLSGIVGFVGLVAPYLGRGFSTDERAQLFASAGIGAALVLLSDLAARTLISGQELPLGTLLALIGAPFFIWLVLRHKDEGII